jgi:prophage maintenance system killer protein
MIRHLSLEELLELHRLVLQQTGGLEGVRDLDKATPLL